jgi:hypothetical protein
MTIYGPLYRASAYMIALILAFSTTSEEARHNILRAKSMS